MKTTKISLSNIKGMLNRDEMKKINGGGCTTGQGLIFCRRCVTQFDGICQNGSPGGINGGCYCA
jgi:hypothetical protein